MTLVRELESVRQQILQHLLQALGIGEHRLRQARIEPDEEIDVLRFGNVPECPLDVAVQILEQQVRRLDDDRAGLDLRQVQDVVDECQQIVARGMDRLRKFDLLSGQVAARVLAQLIGEDEQAVERRAQLVRHVGQEFGLVLGGERELLGFFFQGLPRLLDLLVLALDFLVLVREQPRLFLQLLVGLLQFLLPALQLVRQRL